LSASLILDRGLGLCDQEEVGRGVLWLTRGLEVVPPGSGELQHGLRVNLAAWLPRVNSLAAIFPEVQGGTVLAVGFGPDGKTALTAGADRTICRWDVSTSQLIGATPARRGSTAVVAFSPDGKVALTGSGYGGRDSSPQLWDVASNQPLGKPLPHQGAVRAVA